MKPDHDAVDRGSRGPACRRRDGWTSTYSAPTRELAESVLPATEAWRSKAPGREVRVREGDDSEPAFVVEIREVVRV